jgi:hypothetical protein
MGADGYIDMVCPTSGTIPYYNGSNVLTTQTCAGSGIPLATWEALWYQIFPGQSSTSVQSQYRLVNYQNSTWSPGNGWVLIAARNGDSTEGHVRWMPGQINFPYDFGTYYSGTARTSWLSGKKTVFSPANYIFSY